MKRLTRLVSLLALAGTIVPAAFFFIDRLDLPAVKWWMLVSTVAWFAATPFWMEDDPS